jgi:mRNA interferase MazF
MSVKRGDVVIVDWPLSRPMGATNPRKPRPALVVQNDKDNTRMTNTILIMITSVTKRALEPTQLFIDITTPDGKATGLRQDSVVNSVNFLTVEQSKILHVIGSLSLVLMQKVNDCLKAALELP